MRKTAMRANMIEAHARISALEVAIERAVHIIDANLYNKREKVEDAAAILRFALSNMK